MDNNKIRTMVKIVSNNNFEHIFEFDGTLKQAHELFKNQGYRSMDKDVVFKAIKRNEKGEIKSKHIIYLLFGNIVFIELWEEITSIHH